MSHTVPWRGEAARVTMEAAKAADAYLHTVRRQSPVALSDINVVGNNNDNNTKGNKGQGLMWVVLCVIYAVCYL